MIANISLIRALQAYRKMASTGATSDVTTGTISASTHSVRCLQLPTRSIATRNCASRLLEYRIAISVTPTKQVTLIVWVAYRQDQLTNVWLLQEDADTHNALRHQIAWRRQTRATMVVLKSHHNMLGQTENVSGPVITWMRRQRPNATVLVVNATVGYFHR